MKEENGVLLVNATWRDIPKEPLDRWRERVRVLGYKNQTLALIEAMELWLNENCHRPAGDAKEVTNG